MAKGADKLMFRIYYGDETIFEGEWKNAPTWNVVDVMQMDEVNDRPYHQSNKDYYIQREGKIVGVDFIGLIDHLVNELGVVKVGRTIDTRRFLKIRAQADKDFGR